MGRAVTHRAGDGASGARPVLLTRNPSHPAASASLDATWSVRGNRPPAPFICRCGWAAALRINSGCPPLVHASLQDPSSRAGAPSTCNPHAGAGSSWACYFPPQSCSEQTGVHGELRAWEELLQGTGMQDRANRGAWGAQDTGGAATGHRHAGRWCVQGRVLPRHPHGQVVVCVLSGCTHGCSPWKALGHSATAPYGRRGAGCCGAAGQG